MRQGERAKPPVCRCPNTSFDPVQHSQEQPDSADYGYQDRQRSPPRALALHRLTSTTVGTLTGTYQYNANGDMTQMPHLSLMQWDFEVYQKNSVPS